MGPPHTTTPPSVPLKAISSKPKNVCICTPTFVFQHYLHNYHRAFFFFLSAKRTEKQVCLKRLLLIGGSWLPPFPSLFSATFPTSSLDLPAPQGQHCTKFDQQHLPLTPSLPLSQTTAHSFTGASLNQRQPKKRAASRILCHGIMASHHSYGTRDRYQIGVFGNPRRLNTPLPLAKNTHKKKTKTKPNQTNTRHEHTHTHKKEDVRRRACLPAT